MNASLAKTHARPPRLMPERTPRAFEYSTTLSVAERAIYPQAAASFNAAKLAVASPECGDLAGALAALAACRHSRGTAKALVKDFLNYRLHETGLDAEMGRKLEQVLGHDDRTAGRLETMGFARALRFYVDTPWSGIVSADYELDMRELQPRRVPADPGKAPSFAP